MSTDNAGDTMALIFDITMTLDGYIAGPNPTLEQPLGEGGDRIHEWMYRLASFREQHGMSGGTRNADSEVLEESTSRTGAIVMGRKMFNGGEGQWQDDPNADGWWGDDPPFHAPVFILTQHAREPVPKQGGTSYTFVTDGIEAALDQARAAAGERDVSISGGASVARQYLEAGLVDELQIHLVPLLLGGGRRLFDESGAHRPELELTRVINSPSVTHLRYRVVR